MNTLPKRKYSWHAVYLRYRTEKKVQEELNLKGVECYLPLKYTKRYWSDRIKIIGEPLFTSYIFVRISPLEYYDVLTVKGALHYITFENKAVVISDDKIELLKLFVEKVNDNIQVSTERLAKGNIVKITKGPLKDHEGEVIEMRGKNYAILRFNELGFHIQVDLNLNEMELVQKHNIAQILQAEH